jgi:hypothetical protein
MSQLSRPFLHILCDRTLQVGQFNRFFKPNLQKRSGLPHVYLLHGELGQSHGNFVRRLIIDKVQPYAASTKGRMGGVVRHIAPWIQPLDDLEDAKETLRFSIFEAVAPDYDPTEMSAKQLCLHRTLTPFPFIVIQHDFDVADWNTHLVDLIEWYLTSYWAEALSSRLPNQILIFLNFIYPYSAKPLWRRLYPSRRFAKDAFDAFLKSLASAVGRLYPCLLFDELGHLDRIDVCHTLGMLGVHDDGGCPEWVEKLFSQKRGKVSMKDVEQLLKVHYPPQ